jgi:nicotinamide phosphoribosyltransferase
MNINPIYLVDAYKTGHFAQYPSGTELVFSNFTPRKSRMPSVNHSVFFGLRYFLKKYLQRGFATFFDKGNQHRMPAFMPSDYNELIKATLGIDQRHTHIEDLWALDFLPLAIYALPEGSVVPCGVPALVMYNTHPDFYWLPNMLETLLSCTLWQPCTSATIAREYRLLLDKFAEETSDMPEFVDYQAHDFSMRGMSSVESACLSGMAHLQYFKGTDTIPAMLCQQEYYDKPLEICSVPATEHSVMSAGGKESELETFNRLLDTYPTGILSIVSDTWDLWRVITEYLPKLKDRIMARDGKIVIRPDSGDPADIIAGWPCPIEVEEYGTPVQEGVIELLWEIFGGTINSKGFKQLDSHIGCIYGDSITLERCQDICQRLAAKGFASTNIVFGVGSYTYQYNTRDTLGWAMKATYCEINGKGHAITKDPITDDGTKKSHSGILRVVKYPECINPKNKFSVQQNCTWDEFYDNEVNELKLVYIDGKICA